MEAKFFQIQSHIVSKYLVTKELLYSDKIIKVVYCPDCFPILKKKVVWAMRLALMVDYHKMYAIHHWIC